MKLRPVQAETNGPIFGWAFYCPGCEHNHWFPIADHALIWAFNGNMEKPTFSPSLKNTMPPTPYCCHLNLTDGRLIYHGDCSHEYRNRVVDLPEIPE